MQTCIATTVVAMGYPDVTDAAAYSAIPQMSLHHSMLEHSFGMLWLSP